MPERAEGNARRQSVTAGLTVKGAARAIDFYKRAFGAEELSRMSVPDGQAIVHAELRIGSSVIFLSDELCEMGSRSPQTLGGTTAGIYLMVGDADAVFARAVEAGATAEMEVEDTFWGDRMGSVVDPFGHRWAVATHKEDVPPEEMRRRAEDFFKNWAEAKEHDVQASV